MYKSGQEGLLDHIQAYKADEEKVKKASVGKASYGVDSPFGFAASLVFSPLYAFATLKGKFQVWDKILANLPDQTLAGPSLDAGCGRGLVLIKTAKAKKQRTTNSVSKSYGIDIFLTSDQSGNSPEATCFNAFAENVGEDIVLLSASFCDLPFENDTFELVTSSLALHNPNQKSDRIKAVQELARVTKPGGVLVILDLSGPYTTKLYEKTIKELGWEDVKLEFSGFGTCFGLWYCHTITARKPN
ncbi:hypothetical protein L7F22_044228 [Adiantum nelumboides]|nr:hypothetical protein [Adiantum nelumboides]